MAEILATLGQLQHPYTRTRRRKSFSRLGSLIAKRMWPGIKLKEEEEELVAAEISRRYRVHQELTCVVLQAVAV